jgi:hypothetical protein
MHTWADGEPTRLRRLEADKGDPDPKALACYGLLRADTGGMMVRFVAGRPVSQVTEDFLGWACARLAAEGKRALLHGQRTLNCLKSRDFCKVHPQNSVSNEADEEAVA